MLRKGVSIQLEVKLNQSTELVWGAITDVELMRKWFFDNIPDFKAEAGFQVQFPVSSANRVFTHLWTIEKVEPGRFLSYSWKYDEYQGDSVVNFSLSKIASGTFLKFHLEILESFPVDVPEFTRDSCVGGWNYFLKDRLVTFLNNK